MCMWVCVCTLYAIALDHCLPEHIVKDARKKSSVDIESPCARSCEQKLHHQTYSAYTSSNLCSCIAYEKKHFFTTFGLRGCYTNPLFKNGRKKYVCMCENYKGELKWERKTSGYYETYIAFVLGPYPYVCPSIHPSIHPMHTMSSSLCKWFKQEV